MRGDGVTTVIGQKLRESRPAGGAGEAGEGAVSVAAPDQQARVG